MRMRRLNSFRRQIPVFARALGLLSFYTLWTVLFRVIFLTVATYFLMSEATPMAEISEFTVRNHIFLSSATAILFVSILCASYPLYNTSWREVFPEKGARQEWLSGLLGGFALAIGFTLAMWIAGYYQFWGFFIQSENPLLTALTLLLRLGLIAAWVYAEEFLFRSKLYSYLLPTVPPLSIAVLSTGAFVILKWLQFDLSPNVLLTLVFVSLRLCMLRVRHGTFTRGAVLWGSFLCSIHLGLSLPVFGTEFSGVVYFRFQEAASPTAEALMRFLSGGAEGPLASAALQLVLVGQIIFGLLRRPR